MNIDKQECTDPMDIVRSLCCIADMANQPNNGDYARLALCEDSPLIISARNACTDRGFSDGGLTVDAGNVNLSMLTRALASAGEVIAGLKIDADRYRWLRRRAFQTDHSEPHSFTVSFFDSEGPTGEFFDGAIDAAINSTGSAK